MGKNHFTRGTSEEILQYMEFKLCCEPPEPFILAGRIIQDLSLKPSDFYLAIGQVLGYRIGEYREGKKKYYYLLEMVHNYQHIVKKNNKSAHR